MIIAGERDHNQSTLELDYDMRDRVDVIAIKRWRDQVGGGVYARDIMTLPISDDPALREKLVADLAAALGVPYTATDRRKALEQDERAKRQGDRVVFERRPAWHGLGVQESGL